jgi:folate-binding protein YgfZ
MTAADTSAGASADTSGYEHLVAASGAVLLDRDVVRVAGPEATSYLQGQLSQDVAALAVGDSTCSLVLQPQGKIDVWARVTCVADDEFVLDTDGGFGAALVSRLARFKLRVKADIGALDWACVAVRGPTSTAPPAQPGAVVARAAWPLIGGWDLLGPDLDPVPGVPVVSAGAYEVRRIEAGLPRMGVELTERTIPEEAGIVAASVSFTKGCYTGQELVARIDSRGGHVPHRLRGLRFGTDAPVPARGAEVEVGGRSRGTVTSAARHPEGHVVALAYLSRDVEPPAEGVCAGSPVRIAVVPPG